MEAEHGEILRDDWKSLRAMSAVGDGTRCQREMLMHGQETVMKCLGPGAGEESFVEVKERHRPDEQVAVHWRCQVEHGCQRG